MLLYAHILWLALAEEFGCGPDGDEMYRLLLGMVPLTIGAVFLLQATRELTDVHKILRWFGILPGLLVPFGIISVAKIFKRVNAEGQAICGESAAPAWQHWWAPTQVIVLILIVFMIVAVWRTARSDPPG